MKLTVEEASIILGFDMSVTDEAGGHYSDFELLDNGIVEYMYVPGPEYDDIKEYVLWQFNPEDRMERHSGITPGCFFTDWV